jgi:hypothetical protein
LALVIITSPAVAGAATYKTAVQPHFLSDGPARLAATFGVVTSTFRTVQHNRDVGGVPNSYHLLGQAIDVVRRPGIKHSQIAAALRAAGYNLVESLDEGDHSHFAVGPVAPHTSAPPPAPAKPAPPPLPPEPRVAADVHGQLLVDLAREPAPPTQESQR